jgi:uncharacterized protein (DUF1501 family)
MKRRTFIKNAGLSAFVPAFFETHKLFAAGQVSEQLLENDNVLVIVQMSGGNDGLNTIIPISNYANYYTARTNIAIPEAALLKIQQTDTIGLHPSLKGIWELMQTGKANIIQDIGYPTPNFSHFRATDIWHTASNSNEYLESGWTGRYLALQHPNFPEAYPNSKHPDPLAIQVGSLINPSLQGPLFGMGMAINDTSNFYSLLEGKADPVPDTLAGKGLNFLRQVSKQSNRYSDVIKNAALKVPQQATYPNLSLANQLKIVSRLIAGGLKTKVYYVSFGGFDTHSVQVDSTDTTKGNHANLLNNLSASIKAFMDDLKFLGVEKKVIGMTYSEFGRRVKSNASVGTDHGAAAPMFMFGENVNPVYLGKATPIGTNVLAGDNVQMQYDFRSVYASVLKDWFCASDSDIKDTLLRSHQQLDLVNKSVCNFVLANEPVPTAGLAKAYPNPFESFFNVDIVAQAGLARLEVYDMKGYQVLVPFEEDVDSGNYTIPVDASRLPSGTYMLRYQNNSLQEIDRIIKL